MIPLNIRLCLCVYVTFLHSFTCFCFILLGVVQNATLIVTCNYRARHRGVPKMAPVETAQAICPDMKFAGSHMPRYR